MLSARYSCRRWVAGFTALGVACAPLPSTASEISSHPLELTQDNQHDFLCHYFLYNAYTSLVAKKGPEDAVKSAYGLASYFIGKLVGRNGDNFSVDAEAIKNIKKPYAAAEERAAFMRTCLDEYDTVFGKIEERQ